MPTKPLSHAQRQADPALAQAKAIRSSARWRRVRKLFLTVHPLCEDIFCVHGMGGQATLATQVDHILPLAQGGAPFDEANLQALCRLCHSRKSQRERRG